MEYRDAFWNYKINLIEAGVIVDRMTIKLDKFMDDYWGWEIIGIVPMPPDNQTGDISYHVFLKRD